MIVSFDGNVFAGKTTIISCLSSAYGFNKISEYCDVLGGIPMENNLGDMYKNEQLRYLKSDKKRMLQIDCGINLLDRSFVSMSAHVYSIYRKGLADIRSFYIEKLKSYLDKNAIIIPDRYVIVFCLYRTACRRYRLGNNIKKTKKEYINEEYFNLINEFNLMWSKKFPCISVNTEGELNRERILNFIYDSRPNRKKSKEKILTAIMEIFGDLNSDD